MTIIPQNIPQNAVRPRRWSSTSDGSACSGDRYALVATPSQVLESQHQTCESSRLATVDGWPHRRANRPLIPTKPTPDIKSP